MTLYSEADGVTSSRLVDLLGQSQLAQHFQGAVDASDARRRFKVKGQLINLLRGKWDIAPHQDPHHLQTRLSDPESILVEGCSPIINALGEFWHAHVTYPY